LFCIPFFVPLGHRQRHLAANMPHAKLTNLCMKTWLLFFWKWRNKNINTYVMWPSVTSTSYWWCAAVQHITAVDVVLFRFFKANTFLICYVLFTCFWRLLFCLKLLFVFEHFFWIFNSHFLFCFLSWLSLGFFCSRVGTLFGTFFYLNIWIIR
jgi:hypothetical protein